MEHVIARLQPLSTLYAFGVQRAIELTQSANVRCAMDCILDSMRQYDLDPIFETPFDMVQWDDARYALDALMVATFPEAFALSCFEVMADSKSLLVYEAGLAMRQQLSRLLMQGKQETMHGLTNLLKGFVLIYHFAFSVARHPITALIDANNALLAVDRVFSKHWCEVTRLQLRHYIKGVIHSLRTHLVAAGFLAVVLELDRRCCEKEK